MKKMKVQNSKQKSQAVLEYVILFAVVLAGMMSAAFFADTNSVFQNHFNECVNEINE